MKKAEKQIDFYVYLNQINNKNNKCQADLNMTNSSDYQNMFQKYSKNKSIIERINQTFDNGNIMHQLVNSINYIQPPSFINLSKNSQENIQEINKFFHRKDNNHHVQINEPLVFSDYAEVIADLRFKEIQLEEQTVAKSAILIEQPKIARSETVATRNPIQSKIQLILSELDRQKKRKDDCPMFIQVMQMRLNEFIEQIVGDDQNYIGLTLEAKAEQIFKEIYKFKGKKIQGWLVLVLLNIFYQEFRELQALKVQKLRQQRKSEYQKFEVKSQMDAKSSKSSYSSMKGKYSEPNSRRSHVKEEDWIGALK